MLLRVNKNTGSRRRPVKYSALNNALSAATSSGIWHDDETSALSAPKRQNRIKLTREKAEAIKNADMYDA